VVRVPATERAVELGHALGGSMVMAGAYASLSGVVGIDALVEGMRESIPSYRTQHISANETALRAGWELAATRHEGVAV
jgi:Pyruvate/2-oxoacid:ferredoxin oxidoreductase gamma subunit